MLAATACPLPNATTSARYICGLSGSPHKASTRESRAANISCASKQSLQQQGKSPYTYFTYVAVIKIFYRYCAAMHYYDDIGKGLQSSIRMHAHCKHPLSVAETQRLLNSIETKTIVGKRDKLIIALMLLNGLRSCEVSRINIGDIERVDDRVLLHIQRKGHLDKRDVVALPELTVELYEDYIAER